MVDKKLVAYICTTVFMLMCCVCIGADVDYQNYLAYGGRLAPSKFYPTTYDSLNAAIAFNILLMLLAIWLWFLIMNPSFKKHLNIVAILFIAFYFGRFTILN